jgi:hypothetical protein
MLEALLFSELKTLHKSLLPTTVSFSYEMLFGKFASLVLSAAASLTGSIRWRPTLFVLSSAGQLNDALNYHQKKDAILTSLVCLKTATEKRSLIGVTKP